MKLVGAIAVLIGLVTVVFAIMTWRELRAAATSELAPTADSMPLTRVVYPELFELDEAEAQAVKPAELAQSVFNRIYMIGGASLALIFVGLLLRLKRPSPQAVQDN